MKTCPKCKETKDLLAFHKDSSRRTGYAVYCKCCIGKVVRNSYLVRKNSILLKNKSERSRCNANNNRWYKNGCSRDPGYKLARQLRTALARVMKGRKDSLSKQAILLLGCSIEEFKIYIESKFKPGMTWQNWNLRGWHMDHIRPLNSFDFTIEDNFKKAFHFTNLQPLWAFENLSKGDRIGFKEVTIKLGTNEE